MKTVAILKKEIEVVVKEIVAEEKSHEHAKKAKNIKKLRAKLPPLKFYLKYIQTDPSEDYIYKEIERLTNRVSLFQQGYKQLDPDRFSRGQVTAHRKAFEKEMGIPKLREQLKALNYILK